MTGPTREFWEQRFAATDTPWDRGAPNPQLATWLVSGELAPCRILVPGCGSGHEVGVLARAGFEGTGLDYAPGALARAGERLSEAQVEATLVEADVLAWEPSAPFDAIYEQTCLCALHPDQWRDYADQLARWLKPGGGLFALFMRALRPGAAEGLIEGPPYHSDINAMRALFPSSLWTWPPPPYPSVAHPIGHPELAIVLLRREA